MTATSGARGSGSASAAGGKWSAAGCDPRSRTAVRLKDRQDRHTAHDVFAVAAGPTGRDRGEGSALKVTLTSLPGVLVFTPTPARDDRGFFTRTFDLDVAKAHGVDGTAFVQDSQSRSRKGVVRALHLRLGEGEAKLVRCSYGAVFDVVVDLRSGSRTYRSWISLTLDDATSRAIYVPRGCAHGFQALTDPADVCYRIDARHEPAQDVTIAWNDPELSIPWPLPVRRMTPRDAKAPPLAAVEHLISG